MTQAAPPDFDVFVTATEAFPAFERAVLDARQTIHAGFRIFDMQTRLRSAEARAVGETWFDLLAQSLRRGVTIRLVISDFDPVYATDLHEETWRTMRQAAALREVTGCSDAQLRVEAAMHPARAGLLPWLAFLLPALRRRRQEMGKLSDARLDRHTVGLRNEVLPQLATVSHHQKIAVIDDTVLYIGGLDLNERRFDDPGHDRAPEQTWSDVQVMIRGPEVREAAQHLKEFQNVVTGQGAPSDLRWIKRTLSRPRRLQFPYLSPASVLSEIETTHVEAFHRARHLIYLETQFFRSSRVAENLAEAARRNSDLTCILVLPAMPEDVAFEDDIHTHARFGNALQSDALACVSDAMGSRFSVLSPVQPRLADRDGMTTLAGSPVVYVHNKVLVEDDRFALIGSANLNGRSMRWDTEAAVAIEDSARMTHLRHRLFQHWWGPDLPDAATDPATQQAWWDGQARRNAVLRPENRRGFLVPHDATASEAMRLSLPGVTEDIV
ncbi:MAG: phospholipase D family protein [Pseudomonadota bacterium]